MPDDASDLGGEVRLGSMLFTLVEPHRGHEVAYHRWYERDHFYAGCLVGPWLFAGRRWVATRDLKALRFGTEVDRFGGAPSGRTWPCTGSSRGATTTTSTGPCARCTGSTPTAGCSPSGTTSTR